VKLINLTGHKLNIPHLGLEIPPAMEVAKANQRQNLVCIIDQLPVFEMEYVRITGLPGPVEGVVYIVPSVVLNAVKHLYPERTDCLATHRPIKDAYGVTIGCSALRSNG